MVVVHPKADSEQDIKMEEDNDTDSGMEVVFDTPSAFLPNSCRLNSNPDKLQGFVIGRNAICLPERQAE